MTSRATPIQKIQAATTTTDLGFIVDDYLDSIGQGRSAACETYAETAERLNDPIMAAADAKWLELDQ
jgi:hypothetical protein